MGWLGKMLKQVIVIRTDLNMRKGKMCAQVAHASIKAILNYIEDGNIYSTPNICEWLNGLHTKIVVGIGSERELLDLHKKLIEYNEEFELPESLILDSGLTEFHNVPTYTCVAVGPGPSEVIDRFTGRLKLL